MAHYSIALRGLRKLVPRDSDPASDFDAPRGSAHTDSHAPLRPVLVLALDGATFDVIKPMVADGELPNLARLMAAGQASPLPSTTPPVTFPAWSSFMTGVSPADHGIFDFTQKLPGDYRLRFV
jgi:hypothetical protein